MSVTASTLLPEDADERRMFNEGANLHGSATEWMACVLEIWGKTAHRHGSFQEQCFIMANELRRRAPKEQAGVDEALRPEASNAEHSSPPEPSAGEGTDEVKTLIKVLELLRPLSARERRKVLRTVAERLPSPPSSEEHKDKL